MGLQVLPPRGQLLPFNAQRKMAGSIGPVRGEVIAFQSGLGDKSQQNVGSADLEENVVSWFLGNDLEAQNSAVEVFGSVEVIDVDTGFNDSLNFH
jgi:hypothetical protein